MKKPAFKKKKWKEEQIKVKTSKKQKQIVKRIHLIIIALKHCIKLIFSQLQRLHSREIFSFFEQVFYSLLSPRQKHSKMGLTRAKP
jgi:hypothetical protein